MDEAVNATAGLFGLAVSMAGIKDVILPGEMKELLNKVIETRTAAEAAVITRREEIVALRLQTNAAKMLGETLGLMKLRELEAIERIAAAGNLSIVIGNKTSPIRCPKWWRKWCWTTDRGAYLHGLSSSKQTLVVLCRVRRYCEDKMKRRRIREACAALRHRRPNPSVRYLPSRS